MDYKSKCIQFSLKKKALIFGEFQLKSGRISPYFFNSGVISIGKDILKIGLFYANLIMHSKVTFDILFGTAYKGIPIVIATSIALSHYYNINVPYSFNRKEKKIYGEKGILIGKKIQKKKIIILDDVITSGSSLQQSCNIIEEQGGIITSIFVLLDRQEKKDKILYNNQNIYNSYKINSIMTTQEIILYLIKNKQLTQHIPNLKKYIQKYNVYEK